MVGLVIRANSAVGIFETDTTPDAFSFVDQSNVSLSATITSASITVAGLGAGISTTATVSGGQHSKNGAAFTSSSFSVVNGDTVRVQHTSSASNSTAIATIETIGGVSDTFTSTTTSGSGTRLVGDEYFASVITGSGDGPNFGFDGVNISAGSEGNSTTRTYNATGGPANRPFVRIVSTDTTSIDEWSNEWTENDWYPVTAQWGQSTFLRFSIRLQNTLSHTYKLFIFSAGTPQNGDDRFIITIQDWAGAGILNLQNGAHTFIATRTGSYGGEPGVPDQWGPYSETGMPFTATNTWYDIQVEIRWPTAPGAANGYLKCWIDNDNYASTPYTTPSSIPLTYETGDNQKFFGCFAYWQNMGGGSKTVDVTDLRIGPTFDANWNASGS